MRRFDRGLCVAQSRVGMGLPAGDFVTKPADRRIVRVPGRSLPHDVRCVLQPAQMGQRATQTHPELRNLRPSFGCGPQHLFGFGGLTAFCQKMGEVALGMRIVRFQHYPAAVGRKRPVMIAKKRQEMGQRPLRPPAARRSFQPLFDQPDRSLNVPRIRVAPGMFRLDATAQQGFVPVVLQIADHILPQCQVFPRPGDISVIGPDIAQVEEPGDRGMDRPFTGRKRRADHRVQHAIHNAPRCAQPGIELAYHMPEQRQGKRRWRVKQCIVVQVALNQLGAGEPAFGVALTLPVNHQLIQTARFGHRRQIECNILVSDTLDVRRAQRGTAQLTVQEPIAHIQIERTGRKEGFWLVQRVRIAAKRPQEHPGDIRKPDDLGIRFHIVQPDARIRIIHLQCQDIGIRDLQPYVGGQRREACHERHLIAAVWRNLLRIQFFITIGLAVAQEYNFPHAWCRGFHR